ncbi:hypothetical protein HPB49_005931 [Dermacentor silvarum]|uniref:Uncharacterized protein n=1 Tax=Dermacentor silvarum TaxID=543639 RepID=A0ACB8DWA0_DERSI|nr:hypothetical protein HPB49_005931 [Dermacentor silvarum]
MTQVQVNGEDISLEEFLEGNGWCTIRYKTQSNRETAQSNTQNGAHSHTGEGANGNRQRSRQQQRSDFKIVIRPRGGPDVGTTGTVRLASAIYREANVPAQEAGGGHQLEAITIGDRRHEVSAYETAPDYTVKGIIRGIPLEEDAKSIHTNIIHGRNPHDLAAKRLSNTKTATVVSEGPRVPSYVRYGGALLPCALRIPRRTATRDTETTEKVSWADAVTGKRAPTAKAGDKTPAETEIAKLAQAIQALRKQIEHMQTQIRAKDELIEQLQHAVKSAIRDAQIDALEARLSNLEETIIASITRTIQQSLESVHLRLSRLEATNSTILNKEIEKHALTLQQQQWEEKCAEMDSQLTTRGTWQMLRYLIDPANTRTTHMQGIYKIIHAYGGTEQQFLRDAELLYISQTPPLIHPDYMGESNATLDAEFSFAEI